MTDVELTGPRLSAAVTCARRCVYGAQGAPVTPFDPEQLKILNRGKAWGKLIANAIVAGWAERGRRARREELIPWPREAPVGTGHADVYVPVEHKVVEIVSNAGGTLSPHKALQAAWYTLEHPNAEVAVVDSVNTHTGEEHIYPIDVSGLEPTISKIKLQVLEGLAGELPDRVCDTPWDGPAQWCPHVEHCFADWTPTPLDELLATRGELDLVDLLADRTDEVAAAKEQLKLLEQDRDELRSRLGKLFEPGTEAIAGAYRVRHGNDYVKRTMQLKAFLDAGHPVPDILWPYINEAIVPGRWTGPKRIDG